MKNLFGLILAIVLLAACNDSSVNNSGRTDSADTKTNISSETGDSIDMRHTPGSNTADTSSGVSETDTTQTKH